jgi:lipid II:glycine glycyltransferase (peptidoglycan interpeptide bridge formation enzyme)
MSAAVTASARVLREAEPLSGWQTIPRDELAGWNERLLETDASLFQYPYWNEPLRKMHFSPRYLTCSRDGRPVAYACVLTLGIGRLRIGLLQRGPVSLLPGQEVPAEAIEALYDWAKSCGCIFLRITHSDPAFLERTARLAPSIRTDAFPFYRDLREELVVELLDDEERMLAGFQKTARQEIRKAAEAGFIFQVTDSAEELARAWPLFAALSSRKGFRYRPLSSYIELMRLAQPQHLTRLYVARWRQEPVEAILIVRDRNTAYYLSGALQTDALQGTVSPSCLLHWRAMRDFFHLGVKHYHFGTRSGVVYQFKRKFRPLEMVNPLPVSVVIHPGLYRLWSTAVVRWGPSIWPRIKRLLS